MYHFYSISILPTWGLLNSLDKEPFGELIIIQKIIIEGPKNMKLHSKILWLPGAEILFAETSAHG